MTAPATPEDDLKRWKDKFFAQAEAFEQQEQSLRDYVHLLQRVLVRVSIAAEGLDPRLDKELENLRLLMRRDDASKTALTHQLDSIERAVLKLDEDKQNSGELMLTRLTELVEQLLNLDLAREQKRQLKHYGKQLRERLQNLRDYPNLLGEYAALQNRALAALLGPDETPKTGVLQRLFGNWREERTEAPSQPPEAAAATDEFALQEDVQAVGDGHLGEPGFSVISEHVCNSLLNLIAQLTLPEPVLPDAERIRETITSGLNWYELGPTIDDIANLVISAVSRGQRDFESFLKSLDSRLAALQSFITEGQKYQEDSRRSNNLLDQVVRGQVQTISNEVLEATDLESLKQSVQRNLDTIMQAMDEFVRTEDHREQELNHQLQALQQRLVEMEREGEQIRKRLVEERHKALTDILTGLPNREAYQERQQLEYERWARYGNPLTLVVADIDYFKRINDRFGHLAGDKVIQIIAKEIRRRIRRTDFVARFGGEEFVILMPETTLAAALPVLEKAREMIQKLPFHFRNERVEITMSFGLCDFRKGLSARDVFEKADQALYRAKQDGRNRVASAD